LPVSIITRSDKADSNITRCNELYSAQFLLSFFMDRGIRIDCKDEHSENAYLAICVNFDPDSNASEESELHGLKQWTPRDSTEAGRQIDSNFEQSENAHPSIRASFDPDPNENSESDFSD
jgi:hypothetical protein